MIAALLIFIPLGLPVIWAFVHFSLKYRAMKRKEIEIVFELQ